MSKTSAIKVRAGGEPTDVFGFPRARARGNQPVRTAAFAGDVLEHARKPAAEVLHRYLARKHGRTVRSGVRYARKVKLGPVGARGKRKRIATYRRSRTGAYVRRTTYRTVAGAVSHPISLERACERVSQGQTYSRILRATVPVLRKRDPGAQVVGGELSPVPGVSTFAGAVDWSSVDAVSVHPYLGHDPEFSIDRLPSIVSRFPKPVIV